MLLRFAKLAGGLRLLVAEMAPLVITSTAMLSVRSAAYLVGFALGSIGTGWLTIIATLVAVTGFFNAGAGTAECEAYRAQMRAIDNANKMAMAEYQLQYKSWYEEVYQTWFDGPFKQYEIASAAYYSPSNLATWGLEADKQCKTICSAVNNGCISCAWGCKSCFDDFYAPIVAAGPQPPATPTFSLSPPTYQTYPACSSPDCPPGKKVWVQVVWASPTGNFSDAKGCFIIAYSQDAPDIPVNIEYNPFLPEAFVRSRAISYYLVDGDRFRGLNDNDWQNLESVSGWDKGYWKAEQTDAECRGWRPGWSRKIK